MRHRELKTKLARQEAEIEKLRQQLAALQGDRERLTGETEALYEALQKERNRDPDKVVYSGDVQRRPDDVSRKRKVEHKGWWVRRYRITVKEGGKKVYTPSWVKLTDKGDEATKEEARGSELIVKSIEDVSKATSRNMEVFAELGEMVASLSEHSKLLQEEMGRFKVDGRSTVGDS